jgi:short-subunit dehydrogenase
VTGASSGIGLELAKQFADHGFDLVVAAEEDELAGAAREPAARGVQVEPVRVDLGTAEGVDELVQHVVKVGRPLDAAALNAGIGSGGGFDETPLEQELQLVDLNVRSTVQLAKYVVRDMAGRGQGRIPGPTDTEFFERAGMTDMKLGSSEKDDPADVARDGFEALMAGKERVVSASLKTRVQGRAGRLVPDSVKAKMHGEQARPGSGA